ncbi:MAG: ABC transporter permease [Nitrososphaerota archaeon]|nr:ABC transporter permease [Nitrososphaerota archaeon]
MMKAGLGTMASLLAFDLREAFDSPLWVAYFWLFFAFQFAVYGSLMSRLVVSMDHYLFYYGTGLIVLLSFNVASWAGRRFVESAHEGRLRYLLSLPLGRNELFFEQVVLGVAVNLSRVMPPLVFVLWASHLLTAGALLYSVLVLSLTAVGIIGLMVSLSVIAFRSFDMYSAIVAAASALLIRFSTLYYPVSSMTPAYGDVASANPLSYGADLFRAVIGLDVSPLLDPRVALAVMLALCVGTVFMGTFFMSRMVEGVKSS